MDLLILTRRREKTEFDFTPFGGQKARTLCPGVRPKMCLNIILDFLLGALPFVEVFLAAILRCNMRNVTLPEEQLKKWRVTRRKEDDRGGVAAVRSYLC
jgi:hypothetical protein